MSRPWDMTRHAADRIQEMCIPPQVIRDVLAEPERTYDTRGTMARRTPNGPRRMYCKGKLAILVASDQRRILTVLWSDQEVYDRGDITKVWEEGGWIDY